MAKRPAPEPTGIYVRPDRHMRKRIDAAREAEARARGGHLPLGSFALLLIVEALDARTSTATE